MCPCMDVQGCHNFGPQTPFLSSLGPVFKLFGGKRKAISCLVLMCILALLFLSHIVDLVIVCGNKSQ